MAKGSNSTRSSGASGTRSATISGGGNISEKGILRSNSFLPNTRLSDFEGQSFGDGGYYTLTTSDSKHTMVIETTNGYDEEQGAQGTRIAVGIQQGLSGRVQNLSSSFVEATPLRESGGRSYYDNDSKVAARVNSSMPYYAELANNWIKNHR